jgi:Stress responsive A/B Barrel Domain
MARSDDDMILHLAVFTFTDDVSADDVDRLTSELTAMAAQIPELRRYQCGSNLRLRPSAADYGVAALVDDEAGLSAYLDSAEHAAVYERLLGRMIAQRSVVQLDVDDAL